MKVGDCLQLFLEIMERCKQYLCCRYDIYLMLKFSVKLYEKLEVSKDSATLFDRCARILFRAVSPSLSLVCLSVSDAAVQELTVLVSCSLASFAVVCSLILSLFLCPRSVC